METVRQLLQETRARHLLFPDLFGNTSIEIVRDKIAKFNDSAYLEEAKEKLLNNIFSAKVIINITIGEYVCIGKSAYEADQRQLQFSEMQRNHFVGELSGDFSNIVFGGPQPPDRHDNHVWQWRMLDIPKQYKPVFKKRPRILAEIQNTPPGSGIQLLHEKLQPLPGMCHCTSRMTWVPFTKIPLEKITRLKLRKSSDNSYRLEIFLSD